ncbi:MAG: Mur ligase domain-containing protein [Minisyncoccia bacterium]
MKNIHFIGICGAGMAGIATMLKREGYSVSGSDEGFYDPIASYLRKSGFAIVPGYREENIPENTDTIVIGKHAKLVPEDNSEVAKAFSLKDEGRVHILSFPELLQEITTDRTRIVVAGSYGKSTVTALLAWCLSSAGKNPGYFIGAQVYGLEDPCVLGTGPFIFEGDEYPAANWDTRSKFEFYHPHYVLLTSGEHDHVNIFPTHESFLERFERLLGALPDNTLTIGGIENDSVDRLLLKAPHSTTYGVERGLWHANNIVWGEETTFDVYHNDTFVIALSTTLLGKHNIQNCVGAIALLMEAHLLTPEEIAAGIKSFQGVKRRLDRIDHGGITPVYEGFGSAYAKARSAIEALNLHYPNKKIYCIFEPHTFSWRDIAMAFWYKDVFDGVNSVAIVTPPKEHGKDIAGQLTVEEILQHIETPLTIKHSFTDKDTALASILSTLSESPAEYCVLILTSGEALGLGSALIEWSEKYE